MPLDYASATLSGSVVAALTWLVIAVAALVLRGRARPEWRI